MVINLRQKSYYCYLRTTAFFSLKYWRGLVYADWISDKKIKLLTPKRGVLGMILNCIWWWGNSFRGLGSVNYPFVAINSWSTLTQSLSTCWVFHQWVNKIFLKNDSYLIGSWAKIKNFKKQLHKNVNTNVQWMRFPNHKAENNPRQIDMPLISINQPILNDNYASLYLRNTIFLAFQHQYTWCLKKVNISIGITL